MSDETYYSVLEIPETASAAEVKSAYLRLIREVHPDRLANAPEYWQKQAESKTKEINEAFSVLSKPAKRRLYDAQLDSYRKSQSPNGRTTAAHTSNPQPSSSAQQHSPSSNNRHSSGHNQSAQRSQSTSQQQGTRASTQAPSSGSQTGSLHVSSHIGAGERLFIASIGALFGIPVAVLFCTSQGQCGFEFLLAMAFLGGIAYLYRRQIQMLLARLGVNHPQDQAWATLCLIALTLIVGKVLNVGHEISILGLLFPPAAALFLYRRRIRQLFVGVGLNRLKYKVLACIIGALIILIGTAVRSNLSAPSSASPDHPSTGLTQSRSNNEREGGIDLSAGLVPAKPADHQSAHTLRVRTAAEADATNARGIEHRSQPVDNGSNGPLHLASSTKQVDHQNQSSLPVRTAVTPTDRTPVTYQASTPNSTETPNSPDLSGLNISDRSSIQTACSLAYGQGPASYHRCLSSQLAELARSPNPPDLSGLSISDRNSIQTACSLAYGQGPVPYHRCLSRQLAELARSPSSPDLSGLSISDRNSIQTACSLAYGQGPVSYHRCLNRQLAELATSPKSPDLSGLSTSDRGSIQTACSLAYGQGPASYHRCLIRQLAALGSQ